MKLPNADTAVVDLAKLRDYCLNPFHARGKHKARVFFDALGLTAANANLLANAITTAVRDADANLGDADQHGQRYWADLDPSPLGKSARVRTAWIVRPGENRPVVTRAKIGHVSRPATCYSVAEVAYANRLWH